MVEQFRSSLFGYSKQSVHTYISQLNEDFSQKLLEKDQENRKAVEQMQEELTLLRQENERLRGERQDVAAVLIDAKTFASGLMQKAEEENQALREQNAALRQAERQRVEAAAGHIDRLREVLRTALAQMDEELEHYELDCQVLRAEVVDTQVQDEVGNAAD